MGIRGAGKGVGDIVGGVGGGIELAAKGIGKAVITGDSQAVLTGLGDGFISVGSGLVDGAEDLATAAGEGFFSVGQGLFSGVKSLGGDLEVYLVVKDRNNIEVRLIN